MDSMNFFYLRHSDIEIDQALRSHLDKEFVPKNIQIRKLIRNCDVLRAKKKLIRNFK